MIIQTGSRTDIPAFYSEWFLNRLREGFVLVRNPYDPSSVTRYRLSPDVVDLIGFCTKNPAPMLPHLGALSPFGQHWSVTITPYEADIEPRVPPKERVMNTFRRLSDALGAHRVAWRYDPILVDGAHPVDWHLETFSRMAETLSGYTPECVISFIDLYAKVRRNFPEARAVRPEERARIGEAFAAIGKANRLVIKACAEGDDLARFGIDCSGCMTKETFERALGMRLRVPARKPAREACACLLGADIGAYDTCPHLCRYCYANCDAAAVRRNFRAHDPLSPFLSGGPLPGDVLHEAKQERWADGQISFF